MGDLRSTVLSTIELKRGESMTADTLSRVFAALADPTRRDMVARLSEGDATVSQLAEPYRMTLQAVYKHLRVLEDAGLVSRPRGPQPRPVRLEVQALDLMDTWIERYRQRVEQRYRRLDAVLAEMKGDQHEHNHGDSHRGRPEAAGGPGDS
jgi:DNA-binding transcriptional ArsR family regulator